MNYIVVFFYALLTIFTLDIFCTRRPIEDGVYRKLFRGEKIKLKNKYSSMEKKIWSLSKLVECKKVFNPLSNENEDRLVRLTLLLKREREFAENAFLFGKIAKF